CRRRRRSDRQGPPVLQRLRAVVAIDCDPSRWRAGLHARTAQYREPRRAGHRRRARSRIRQILHARYYRVTVSIRHSKKRWRTTMRIASAVALLVLVSACSGSSEPGPHATVLLKDGTSVSGTVRSEE